MLGAEDAFIKAGFLRGWLRGEPLATACDYANACGAIVVSRHGCAPAMPTWPELERFLSKTERPHRLREDAKLQTTALGHHPAAGLSGAVCPRHGSPQPVRGIGPGAGRRRGPDPGASRPWPWTPSRPWPRSDPAFSLLLDGRFGQHAPGALRRTAPTGSAGPSKFRAPGPWSSRAVRMSPPPCANGRWPRWSKCLVFYHPDDEPELMARQERQILRLADACRRTRHEFLLEISPPRPGRWTPRPSPGRSSRFTTSAFDPRLVEA